MDDTCVMENIHNILLKLNQKCHLGKLVGLKKSIKEKEDEEERDLAISVMLRCRNCDLTDYLWGVGIFSARIGVVARPCEASGEARLTIWILCCPFTARGDKGEAEYP